MHKVTVSYLVTYLYSYRQIADTTTSMLHSTDVDKKLNVYR